MHVIGWMDVMLVINIDIGYVHFDLVISLLIRPYFGDMRYFGKISLFPIKMKLK